MPEVLNWNPSDPIEPLFEKLLNALRQGDSLLLPTEIGEILVQTTPVLHTNEIHTLEGFFDLNDLVQAYPTISLSEQALMRRVWPGPVAISHTESYYPAWIPASLLVGDLLNFWKGKLYLMPVGNPPFDLAIVTKAKYQFCMPHASGDQKLTHLKVNDRRWVITQEGAWNKQQIQERLARRILFLCTGNTCRSPMAVAIFRARLAKHLGIPEKELLWAGYYATSAGVAATEGSPATPEAIEAVRKFGADLSRHTSTQATVDLLSRADDIIGMTRSHLMTALKVPRSQGIFGYLVELMAI